MKKKPKPPIASTDNSITPEKEGSSLLAPAIIEPTTADVSAMRPLNENEKALIDEWEERKKMTPEGCVVLNCKVNETTMETGKRIGLNIGFELEKLSALGSENGQKVVDAAFSRATGSVDDKFRVRVFGTCLFASGLMCSENVSENATAILNALQELKPQDPIEGMQISRIIALHFQSMECLTKASDERLTDLARDSLINRATKLGRLYNETLETLMRYRRKGEQRVVVQHVQVNDGGKAVVGGGNVIAGVCGGGGQQ